MSKLKKVFLIAAGVRAVVIASALALCVVTILLQVLVFYKSYETNDPVNYGYITANKDNEAAYAFLFSYFPESLEDDFEDVVYHYHANNSSAHSMEVYLEFTVSDEERFAQYVTQYTEGMTGVPFPFDGAFTEYIITDSVTGESCNEVFYTFKSEEGDYDLAYVRIGKIMVDQEANRLVFTAVHVLDSSTKFFHYFFSRFDIDLMTYQMAYSQ